MLHDAAVRSGSPRQGKRRADAKQYSSIYFSQILCLTDSNTTVVGQGRLAA